ncbi:X-ray repair cross-complementing protein 5 isoform X2 [Esox lucius]|uniref:X-ray repair cross-complementing protein 5 n=1 Tax=Esox lucius TaxID=8010 RepID=A0A3P8ZV80_ESOLU|nr:X-ray repair cross-complementing protein 5 isoform X1 [Esox lucius]XP_028971603.2 X-ray repair cross-complementing protein 5 isoform X2 [Esox lucius]
MAPSAKSALVLCVDVGFSMSNSGPGQEPPFEQAKKVIQKFVKRQVFAENKDELGLVLFGSDATKNNLAKDGQYQNIYVHRNLMIPDFGLLEEIQNDIHPGGQQGDWLDALVVCMDLLQNETLGKKYDRLNIAVLTDLDSPVSPDQLDIITGNLKRAGITLQFFLPFPMDTDEAGGGDVGGSGPPHGGKGLSREQQQGLDLVKQVMMSLDEEDGLDEVQTFSDAIEKLSVFKHVEKRPMAWPCTLTIGSCLTIKIVGYKAVCEERPRKSWSVVDAQTHQKEDVKRDVVYCVDDDEETEVPKDDTIQGFRYGSDIVPFSKVDQEQMKYKTDGKSFAVLGFAKQSLINRHHFMGNQILKVFAPKDDEHAGVALSALIRALDELKMVAVVRYVYARNGNPQVGAAFPCIKEKYECLMYVQLPFMEDLRQYTFPSLENNKKYTPSENQLSVVDSLIDSMMLVEENEDGEKKDLFKVNHIPNPQYQRLFQCLHHRALNPSAPLPPVEPWLITALQRPQAVAARSRAPLENMKKLFPLKEVVKKKELKTSKELFGKGIEEPDVKKAKVDEDQDFNLADITEGSITQVGSVDPARDFCSLIRQKSLPFGEVCQQLTGRIEQLLGNKNTHYYMKCISCIQSFREQSVKIGNADHYNSYLRSLKGSIPVRGLQELWDLLVQDSLTLISKDEVDGSTVSKQDATEFLTAEEKKEMTSAPVVDSTGDVDDLLDMM